MLRHRALLIVAAALVLPLAIVGTVWGVSQYREAEAGKISATEREATRTAVVRLLDDGTAARTRLREHIEQGRATARAGRTAEPGVMQALQETLSTATSYRAAPAPEEPPPDADTATLHEAHAAADEWLGQLRWMSGELERNIRATEESQETFRHRQAARQAAEKKAQEKKERAARAARDAATDRKPAPTTLLEATAALDRAVTDLPPLVEDAGFTIDWAEQVGVAGDLVTTLRTRLDEAEAALADGEAVRASGSGDLATVARAGRKVDDAFAVLEEASWRARDAGADGSNGRISREELCLVSHSPEGLKQYLTCDAAEAWQRLGAEFEQRFGVPLQAEYGYRAYDLQLWAMAVYGAGQAAEPGTSNHGWGEAIDLPEGDAWRFGGEYYEWLRVHGPDHGWDNPDWARQGNGREEPWHFEFTG